MHAGAGALLRKIGNIQSDGELTFALAVLSEHQVSRSQASDLRFADAKFPTRPIAKLKRERCPRTLKWFSRIRSRGEKIQEQGYSKYECWKQHSARKFPR